MNVTFRTAFVQSVQETEKEIGGTSYWLWECQDFNAEQTVHSVQDGVQRWGWCVYCENILRDQ
jgi:hypothetical protein